MNARMEVTDKLTEAFINYQYRLENPMPTTEESSAIKILRYQTDPIFHAKVKSLVSGVLNIIEDYVIYKEEK